MFDDSNAYYCEERLKLWLCEVHTPKIDRYFHSTEVSREGEGREKTLEAVPHSRSVATTDYGSLAMVSHKNHSPYRTLGMKRLTKFEACLPSYVDVGQNSRN